MIGLPEEINEQPSDSYNTLYDTDILTGCLQNAALFYVNLIESGVVSLRPAIITAKFHVLEQSAFLLQICDVLTIDIPE